ncbi:MAG: hypothetical protein ACK4E0_15430 [Chitinophagaceae bacterium]
MSMKLLSLACVLSAGLLFSCKDCPPESAGKTTLADSDAEIWEMLTTEEFDTLAPWADKRKNYGTVIPFKDVKPCLKLYEETMVNHRVVRDVNNPPPVTDNSKYIPITLWESFRGKELKKFLKKAAARRGVLPSNKKLEIRMAIGIYTKEFAQKYDPSREGRIGIFLVTKKYKEVANVWMDDEDEDDSSFNFGGIHP